MEAFITEAHQAEAIRKTKRRDAVLDHIQVFTLRDFRDATPARVRRAPGAKAGAARRLVELRGAGDAYLIARPS